MVANSAASIDMALLRLGHILDLPCSIVESFTWVVDKAARFMTSLTDRATTVLAVA
jgi:hypothetical protein